ncbi:pre-mRNA cleavage complex 2 protein Pcf11 isoform X2 [Parasteatoda tepidariorum]|uniref:pre-mRNA cleavage complex 2 protein Pcf11 isoform X2 n=1 Tax=Parasteatoda tepidariorum TaxID=114398 RepID=UPI001C725B89|nr:pre-mRNA cleavage complex 2 protein Pcf11 isoform X2 [Parasteatoda tepidariorum]
MAKAVAEDYRSSLLDLNCNSKPHITMLTMIAEENIKYSSAIVDTIVDHIMEVHPSLKLPCLYLVDSIMKNIGKQYLTLFSDQIISLFSAVFEKVDENTRSLLFKLRQTWSGILAEKLLYNLDLIIRKLDPAWPVLAMHSHFNLQGVNIGTQKETVPISSKVIELEKERKLCSKKDMLNQLVEKRKKLQFNMNSETSTKSKFEKIPSRAIKDGFKVMSKDIEISVEDEPFQKHVMETGGFTPDFSFQQTMHSYEKEFKTQEINTTSFLKHISKTKNRKEGVNLKSNRAFFKKHFRRKHAKLGFSEWEQTRKKLMKSDEKINNDTSHNVCSNKQEIETVNQCFDSKHESDSKLKDLNLNQNSLIDNEGICESIPKDNASITDITTHNKTDLNTSDSSTFNEPISRKIDVTFNTIQPEKLNTVLASEICHLKESPMLADKQISFVETNENKVNEHNKKIVEKSEPIDQASESFNALENVNEDMSKTSVKRDFKSVEDTSTKEEIPEKIPRLESCENDQFSSENDQVLFGNQDQDLRRLTDQDFKGWDQYKEVYPDEFGNPKVSCKNLEGKQKSLKISAESNSSCLQFVKEYFLTRMNQHKDLHSREMVRSNENYTADCFDPFLYIQKAEESYRKGEMSAAKFMELLSGNCQEFNKMFLSNFQNEEKTKESQKIESKGVIPSTNSWENCPLSPQTIMIKGTREFILDGQKRTIHFIGNRAFIIFDNGAPHELTFKGEQKSIHIEGLPNPILLNFDGKSAEFEINGKKHTICLGIPTREVYIDNQPYEIKFGGPPLMADLGDGRLCKIFASGPVPQVVIGTEPCFDIVNKFHPSTVGEKCDIKHPEKKECVDEHEDSICESKDFKDVDMRQKPPELHSLLNSDSESLSDVDWRQANMNNKFNDKKNHAINEEPGLKYLACQPLAAYERLDENQESHNYQEENSWNLPTDKSPSHNLKLHKHSEIHSDYPVAEEERCNRNFYPHWNDSRWPEQQWKRQPNEFREPHTFPPPYPPSNQHSEYHQTYIEFQDTRGHRFSPSHLIHEDDGYNSQMNYAKSRPYKRRSGRGARYGFRGSWRVRERNPNPMNTQLEQPQNQQFHIPPPGLLPQISNLVSTSASTSGQPSFREAFEEHVSICSSEGNLNTKVPDVDVDSLMKKLLAAGIINSKPEELKHKADADEIKKSVDKMKQDSPKTEENIPPILLKSECLKVYKGPVISALHRGFQCDSCGLRFSDLKKESYSKHLDWHFRMNRRERSSLKKVSFQHWYYEIEDWIQFEEFDEPDDKSKNFFELQSEELKEETKVPVPSVPATKSETELCTACNEPFQLVWMENEEEWHLHNSVIYEDDVFHPACLVDFKKEKESKVIKDLDFVDPLPVESNSESHDDDIKGVDSEIEIALYDLITQITTGSEMMEETSESLLMCSTDDIKKENDEELVLNQTPLDPKIVKKEDPVESDLIRQDLEILEGKPGEEEIIGVISEADTESDHDLFTEESKMVTMHSGGITLKVKAERFKQTPSSIGTINSSVSIEGQESDDDFRPPTPDPRFQVMPFVKKGKELSGLCVII